MIVCACCKMPVAISEMFCDDCSDACLLYGSREGTHCAKRDCVEFMRGPWPSEQVFWAAVS